MSGTVLGGFTGRAVGGLVADDLELAGVVRRAGGPDRGRGRRAVAVAAAGAGAGGATPRAATATRRGSLGDLLRNRRLVATYAVGFCILFTQVAMFTYVTFHLAAPPYSLSTVAARLALRRLSGWRGGDAVVGRWIDRYGHRAGLASAMASAPPAR